MGALTSPLCLYTAPIAFIMGIVVVWVGGALPAAEGGETTETTVSGGAAILMLLMLAFLMLAFGIALTQVILSQCYTRLVQGNPYVWTFRRFVPWTLSIIIVFAAMFLGMSPIVFAAMFLVFLGMPALVMSLVMLLVVQPAIYLGLRLFWADEFALVHRAGPIQALKESWQLTKGNVGSIIRFQFLSGLVANLVLMVVMSFGVLVLLLVRLGSSGYLEATLGFLIIFVCYGGLHAPEIVYLYGMRAQESSSLVRYGKVLNLT